MDIPPIWLPSKPHILPTNVKNEKKKNTLTAFFLVFLFFFKKWINTKRFQASKIYHKMEGPMKIYFKNKTLVLNHPIIT
jgi:hypothetical protein